MLVLLVVWGFASGAGELGHFLPFVARQPGAPPSPALAGAVISAFFSFGGWWEASKLAGEVRDPQRTLPRALALGVLDRHPALRGVSAVFLYLVPLERRPLRARPSRPRPGPPSSEPRAAARSRPSSSCPSWAACSPS